MSARELRVARGAKRQRSLRHGLERLGLLGRLLGDDFQRDRAFGHHRGEDAPPYANASCGIVAITLLQLGDTLAA